MSDDSALKPCPWCGGRAMIYCNKVLYVSCADEQCIGWTVMRADAAAWNRRAPDQRAEDTDHA